MARPPESPGPPPPNYRPPGAPPTPPPLLDRPVGDRPDTSHSNGAGPGAVTAVALITLLLGLVIGFFLGRATEAANEPTAAPPLTSPNSSTSRPPGNTIPQNTPVDPGAPPSTDLDPTTVGSFDDPIPPGQAYVLGLYEISVVGVDRDATETLASHDSINPRPPAGSQHVIVEVNVRYTENEGFGSPSSIPFFLSAGGERWNDIEAECGIVPDSILDAPTLTGGDEGTWNTCFTVPSPHIDSLVFGTEGVTGPLYFALPE